MDNIINTHKKIYSKEVINVLPGNLAFGLMLSLVPLLTLILVICNSVGLSFELIMLKLKYLIPEEIVTLLLTYVSTSRITLGNIVIMVTGFFSASMSSNSLILTSNLLYDEEPISYIKRKIKSLYLTILLILVVIIAIIILVFGNKIILFITGFINQSYPKVTKVFKIFTVLKWPISFIVLYFIISLIYMISSNKKLTFKNVSKGALFASFAWCITAACYSFYVNHFTSYDVIYGSLSNIIVLLIWLYISANILVLGISINSYNK